MGDSAARDAYADARFTAEISTRMQVPDRIMVSNSPAKRLSLNDSDSVPTTGQQQQDGHYNDLGMRRRDPRLDMQVPDRILVAGDDTHVASKSTPRELQLEAAVLPPTAEHVRVSTPPRSIRLDEHSFPSATDDEASSVATTSTPTLDGVAASQHMAAHPDLAALHLNGSEHNRHNNSSKDSASLALLSDGVGGTRGVGGQSLAPHEELQLIRRQLAKINHRLMAVELENQQQQQREMVLTLLVSAYFVGKIVLWINRSL